LGQFLIDSLQDVGQIVYTYSTRALQHAPEGVAGVQVDLASGDGMDALFQQHGPFHAVVNCAAVSQPAVCEKDYAMARSINVPTQLLAQLQAQQQQCGVEALFIHISTDQVYDGSKAFWSEDDACAPVNAYGRTKVEAEQLLQASWPRHVILRSSIIYGPLPPEPVPRALFLQFVEQSLASGKPTSFFDDEFRCPIFVSDIVSIVHTLLVSPGLPPHSVYNMGGPERLSRADMAAKVAEARGYDASNILAAPSSTVQRPVASPADISMSVSRLVQDLGITLTPFSEALKRIPPSH